MVLKHLLLLIEKMNVMISITNENLQSCISVSGKHVSDSDFD